MLSEHPLDGGRRDSVPFCDLAHALAILTVSLDSCIIQCQWIAADVLAFEAGAPHSGEYPLDDQRAF